MVEAETAALAPHENQVRAAREEVGVVHGRDARPVQEKSQPCVLDDGKTAVSKDASQKSCQQDYPVARTAPLKSYKRFL